ncbi:hypothetical protein JTZ10_16135 [Gordonia rubripertincta]|uniref:Uncharacterized protein n=1 Tax=Gordonia rubripertincta TaxID=36822 RepID=A0AAW4G813_GORRU|nr:hypothetical protein [Gordonia rubripertincta]MBM7279280.1 hypothetical protein [Gordonia rubripertincta]
MEPQFSPRPDADWSDEQIGAILAYAGLDISPDRLAEKADDFRATLSLIRKASVTELGETPPAIGFHASWS